MNEPIEEVIARVRSGSQPVVGIYADAERLVTEVELLREREKQLAAYVAEAAGQESVLIPVTTLHELVPRALNVPREQLSRAVMNVMQLELLRRCHEDRFNLKQRVRALKVELENQCRQGRYAMKEVTEAMVETAAKAFYDPVEPLGWVAPPILAKNMRKALEAVETNPSEVALLREALVKIHADALNAYHAQVEHPMQCWGLLERIVSTTMEALRQVETNVRDD